LGGLIWRHEIQLQPLTDGPNEFRTFGGILVVPFVPEAERAKSTAAKVQRFAADAGPAVRLGTAAAAGFVQVPLAAAGGRDWIEVVLRDGTLVRVPAQQTTALATILRVLRSEDSARQPLVEETPHA
jgi:hypothetical protein